MRSRYAILCTSSFAALLLAGCPDDPGTDAMNGTDSGTETDSGGPNEVTFEIRIENVSGTASLPTPFAPGAWAVHSAAASLFDADAADRGDGLSALAEDGDPSGLAAALGANMDVASSGVFDTPENAAGPGPAFPGDTYVFTVTATSDAPLLSWASMLVQSNDLFAAPAPAGIALFDASGNPIAGGDVTAEVSLWDVGTEANEAPAFGPNQAPRQPAPDTGRGEGEVGSFDHPTRALPVAPGIVNVDVAENAGTYTITVENVSESMGAITTPVAPLFFATHDDTWSLFDEGGSAGAALESLAEDGSPAALVMAHDGTVGTGTVGAQVTTVERPGDPAGPSFPGERFEIMVTPDMSAPRISIAAMVVESNDAFLALPPEGIALLDEMGAPRPAVDVAADFAGLLAVWDAGTEANEVPGVGAFQAPRQPAANMGPADADATVRHYRDATNDLAGAGLGGFVSVTVVNGTNPMDFDVTVTNTSDATVYPGLLTPTLWALHDDTASLFTAGAAASAGLESLAEDGDPAALMGELNGAAGVGMVGVADTPVMAGMPGPLMAGDSYTFTVTADATNRFLSVASMVVPSNDTFMSFGSAGLELVDSTGAARADMDLATDVDALLSAWDAGTELNQAGAAGPDQAPHQAGPDTGAPEGNGLVRTLDDPVWSYPTTADLLRVTITPL